MPRASRWRPTSICRSIAENTPGFSGADLANLVNEAALSATRKGRESITRDDFAEAYDKIVLGDPREAKLDAKEKRRVAVHEGGHAVVARFSPGAEPLHRVTIIPRGMALGATQQSPGADRHLLAQSELESRLRVLMGGYAAERLVLGSISTGAENDLKEATRLASHMVAHYGMSERLGPVYYDHEEEHPFLGQRIGTAGGTSPSTITAIEEEARRLLARALEEAETLLKQRRPELDRLVSALLEHETLERDELATILGHGRRPGRGRRSSRQSPSLAPAEAPSEPLSARQEPRPITTFAACDMAGLALPPSGRSLHSRREGLLMRKLLFTYIGGIRAGGHLEHAGGAGHRGRHPTSHRRGAGGRFVARIDDEGLDASKHAPSISGWALVLGDFACSDRFNPCGQRTSLNADYLWQGGHSSYDALSFHLGLGARFWFWNYANNTGDFQVAARVPIGLDLYIFKWLEALRRDRAEPGARSRPVLLPGGRAGSAYVPMSDH